MSERRPYSRVYWSIVDDPKFLTVYDDDRHLATWLRLLLIADQSWPASAHVPAGCRRSSVTELERVGLIDLSGGRFRVRGLDGEREHRSRNASASASHRWAQSERIAKGVLDETRRELDETSTPKPPPSGGRMNPRANGTNPRAVADRAKAAEREEQEQRRAESRALHQRYLRGELTEAQYDRIRADLGKQPDDLTRAEASR